MKARAGTFSTEEFAMGCSDQGGLPGRRGLRVQAEKRFPQVHIPKLRYGCQPGGCASVVRGETD